MSNLATAPRKAPIPPPRAGSSRGSARPALRVLTPPLRRRSGAPFALFCTALLVGGLLALLMLNTALAQGSFVLHDLQRNSAQLIDREQALAQQVAQSAAPENLAQRASRLGMVPAPNAAFVRLSDGTVVGAPQAATASPGSTVVPLATPITPAAPSPAASPSPTH